MCSHLIIQLLEFDVSDLDQSEERAVVVTALHIVMHKK